VRYRQVIVPPFRFSGRNGDRYYWRRPAHNGLEEVVSCNVSWFWSAKTREVQ
jgi:hypothetical protein